MLESEGFEVITEENIISNYSYDCSFNSPQMPIGVIYPKKASEIKKIVRWAIKNKVPLTPISSPGGPRFRGDTIPSLSGVVIDLSKMKKIIRVDRRNRVVMLEPGVTFKQLRDELDKNDMQPFIPLSPRSTKSVLTSVLEREPILIPKDHWDALDPLCCAEIVYGDGNIFRTGEASGPGPFRSLLKTKIPFRVPMGPGSYDPIRIVQGAQGTLGIVTWASIICQLKPFIQNLLIITSQDANDLVKLVYEVCRRRIGEELLLVNNSCLANLIGNNPEEIESLSQNLPPWITLLNIQGFEEYYPEDKISYQEKEIKKISQTVGLECEDSISGIESKKIFKKIKEISHFENYWKLRYRGGCQEIFFITTLDKIQFYYDIMINIAKNLNFSKDSISTYIQPTIQGVNCHCEFDLLYDPKDLQETEAVKTLYKKASEELINKGAFFNRPYDIWKDMVYKRNVGTAKCLKILKEIYDPNHILNPGKLCF